MFCWLAFVNWWVTIPRTILIGSVFCRQSVFKKKPKKTIKQLYIYIENVDHLYHVFICANKFESWLHNNEKKCYPGTPPVQTQTVCIVLQQKALCCYATPLSIDSVLTRSHSNVNASVIFVSLRRFLDMKHYSDQLQSHTSQLLRARAVSPFSPSSHTLGETAATRGTCQFKRLSSVCRHLLSSFKLWVQCIPIWD